MINVSNFTVEELDPEVYQKILDLMEGSVPISKRIKAVEDAISMNDLKLEVYVKFAFKNTEEEDGDKALNRI